MAQVLSFSNNIIAVDGGAHHLLAAGVRPRAIVGDLDSLDPAKQADFRPLLIPVSEQDTTDFEKALLRFGARIILAAGFLGGRIDHTLASLNTLARHKDKRIILLGDDDVVALVPPEGCRLRLPVGTRLSLVPIGRARMQAKGLRWPLHDVEMATDALISPSNESRAEEVELQAVGAVAAMLPRIHLDAVIAALTE